MASRKALIVCGVLCILWMTESIHASYSKPLKYPIQIASKSAIQLLQVDKRLKTSEYVVPYGTCPQTFEWHGERCYKVMAVQASWAEAKVYCQVIGGDLAKITSATDQTIIAGLVLKSHGIVGHERYWVDGSDMLQSGVWRWMRTNGESIPISYTNWNPGQPDIKTENCVEVRWDWSSRWNNLNCADRLSFICQARASNGGEMKLKEEMDR